MVMMRREVAIHLHHASITLVSTNQIQKIIHIMEHRDKYVLLQLTTAKRVDALTEEGGILLGINNLLWMMGNSFDTNDDFGETGQSARDP